MASAFNPFVFPIIPLSTERVRLEPWDSAKHATLFYDGCKDHPHLFDYLNHGPFDSAAHVEEWYRTEVQEKLTAFAWAIYAKTPGADRRAMGIRRHAWHGQCRPCKRYRGASIGTPLTFRVLLTISPRKGYNAK